jgi:hypothetical protein
VQAWWQQHGYLCMHKGAAKWSVIDKMHSSLALGMGASGFLKQLAESYKRWHLQTARKWRDYCNYQAAQRLVTEQEPFQRATFIAFDSKEYGGKIPSLAYLIWCYICFVEDKIPYYLRHQQMVDGKSWSVDHSMKVTKVILVCSERAYTAMYTVMNEYGQVVAWWLTNTTSLAELKNGLKALKRRYEVHGFEGPEFVTSDRCCQEREFWKDVVGDVFVEDSTELESDELDVVKKVLLPSQLAYSHSLQVIAANVGTICHYLESLPAEQQVVGVDCEWSPWARKAHVVQLGLPDGQTFVFQVANLRSFPAPLKHLLEDSSV